MRVVGVKRFGGPEALQVYELPDQHAGPGQVRVRVHAVAVSPTDTFTRNGSRWRGPGEEADVPQVPGMDCAGVVDEVGEGVTRLAVGDRVMAIVLPRGSYGAYSDSLVLPAESVAHAPAGYSHEEVCTLPMNGLAARLALDALALAPGDTLAVTGAAGALGGYVVQLAKADGLTVVADASDADRGLVAFLGADAVVARGHDVAGRILSEVPGGVAAVVDGALLQDFVVPAVRDGGAIATVRGWDDADLPRGVRTVPVWVRDYARETAQLDRLREQVEAGQIVLRVAGIFPAEHAAEAHRRLEAGGSRGRFVLQF
jgi:NADPH:quinone reductase-like Zn-dependent oxidoreductase